jgi:signal transduction histidine kinase
MSEPYRPRILIVDDDAHVPAALAAQLHERFDIVCATSGAEALERMREAGPFPVVVSDMRMPELDGAQLLARIRQIDPDTVRLLLTGHADFAAAVRAVNDGHIFRLLTKPCSTDKLAAALDDALEQHRIVTGDRKLLERRIAALSADLIRAERFATLGTLAGAVGHELKNIAMVLGGSAAAIEERAQAGLPPESEDLAALAWVGQHVRAHAQKLLNLARSQGRDHVPLDLGRLAADTVAMMRRIGKVRGVSVQTDLPLEPVFVVGNKTGLEQVLVNLISNALDAVEGIPGGRVIRIIVGLDRADATAWLRVQDNGCGIPTSRLHDIFTPYHTSKAPGQGTGLGLTVVRDIVQSHGGKVRVKSQVQGGSLFTVELPVAEAGIAATEAVA